METNYYDRLYFQNVQNINCNKKVLALAINKPQSNIDHFEVDITTITMPKNKFLKYKKTFSKNVPNSRTDRFLN